MSAPPTSLPPAVLLIGPTGSGKTPLGDWLEAHGLWGRRWHHFDFGARLRAVVAEGPSSRYRREEIQFLSDVIEKGVLLENESFALAERVLDEFMARRCVQPEDLLLMNGLPRHVGQALALDNRLRCVAVVQLVCDAATVIERLRRDSGGDRAGRRDDDPALVARKLAIFAERTRPLVEHYRGGGARLISVPVGVATTPRETIEWLKNMIPAGL